MAEAAGVYLDELYSYDGMYRLTEMQRGQLNASNNGIVSGMLSFAQVWSLDATGNWAQFWENDSGASWNLQQTRAANLANEISAIDGGGWARPAYDDAGNMTQMPQSSNPTAAAQTAYDAWNRLMSVFSDGSLIQQNLFDGENRRVTKQSVTTLRHYFYTTQWQGIEERVGSSTTADRQFVLGLRYIDDVVLRDRGVERLYSLHDPNWNVTAICDTAGSIRERYTYGAYGLPTFLSGSFVAIESSQYDWETLFASYRWDNESRAIAPQ